MSAEVPSLTIAILDFNAARSGLPTYSELVEALRLQNDWIANLATEEQLSARDGRSTWAKANAILSRIPS